MGASNEFLGEPNMDGNNTQITFIRGKRTANLVIIRVSQFRGCIYSRFVYSSHPATDRRSDYQRIQMGDGNLTDRPLATDRDTKWTSLYPAADKTISLCPLVEISVPEVKRGQQREID
jgi:hypothetical protein